MIQPAASGPAIDEPVIRAKRELWRSGRTADQRAGPERGTNHREKWPYPQATPPSERRAVADPPGPASDCVAFPSVSDLAGRRSYNRAKSLRPRRLLTG